MDEIILDGKEYISAKRAAKQTGYTKDYVGQLCRAGRLPARMIGRNWYVEESAVSAQRKSTLRHREDLHSNRVPEQHLLNQRQEGVIHQQPTKATRLTPRELASRSPMQQDNAPASRYGPRTIEEAFPMHYTTDDRPLIPTPIRRQRTSIAVEGEKVTDKQKEKRAISKATLTSPSEHVADARAVRKQRFGPTARVSADVVKEEKGKSVHEEISVKQEISKSKRPSALFSYFLLVVIGAVALVTFVASLAIHDTRSYSSSAEGLYELKTSGLELF